MTATPPSPHLAAAAPEIERLLTCGKLPSPHFAESQIRRETVWVTMRDGVRLATDLHLPPVGTVPVVAVRTPYGRSARENGFAEGLLLLARNGYAVVSQDCRGTGDSEPDDWDYYMFEEADGYDLIEWIVKQVWFGGFIGSFGGSYAGQTQWCMATHPAMSAITPSMSGLGVAFITARLYMFLNVYSRSTGKGDDKVALPYHEMERAMLEETLTGGYFNEPLHTPFSAMLLDRFDDLRALPPVAAKRRLWERYCALTGAGRAEFVKQALGVRNVTSADLERMSIIFGHRISQDAHTIPHASPPDMCKLILAPPLLRTGWYDWFLNDALATWELLRHEARPEIAARARMIIAPYAHNMPGYLQGREAHPELMHPPSLPNSAGLLLLWYATVRGETMDCWPRVIYYLMGANEWRVAEDWPIPEARQVALYLGKGGVLRSEPPDYATQSERYSYDPRDPTPTIGGSIVSYVYTPGSVDVSSVQQRKDVLVYTSAPLERDLDVVGSLRAILYASSSAVDTDFVVRLSDVFPDGRALQLQSGILRARYRNTNGDPELLEPGRVYRFEIDLWATANRFEKGHRLRVDVSSADFPHFDRNDNRGGDPGEPIVAQQTIYHGLEYPSHLLVSVIGDQ